MNELLTPGAMVRELHDSGLSYRDIARKADLSVFTLFRAAKGDTKRMLEKNRQAILRVYLERLAQLKHEAESAAQFKAKDSADD